MDKQRLGKAGNAHEQTMAAAKKSVECSGNDFLLADNDFANFLLERAHSGGELFEDGNGVAFNNGRSRRKSRRRLLIHNNVRWSKVSAKYGTLQVFPSGQMCRVTADLKPALSIS